jgi:2-methylcitrate dehydratase
VPAIIRHTSSRRPKPSGARAFGIQTRLLPDAAAFANSVMIRFLDYNDTYGSTVGVGHPSDYIPAAMAQLGEEEIPGELILRAILVGYEVFCRLTDATRPIRACAAHLARPRQILSGASGSILGARWSR